MKITKPKKDKRTGLEKEIDVVLNYMQGLKIDSEEYRKTMRMLLDMYKAKEFEPKRVSPDALVGVGGSLAGILMIIAYEPTHILASKALMFVLKGRV